MKKEERLTFKYKNGKTNYLKYNNDGITDYKYQHGINCLAEYENTGLSPKEVAKLKKENAELKTRLEKAQTTLFLVVRNSILEKREERGIPKNMVDVIAVRTIQKMEDMIDYPSATKARLEAEKALKEKGE